MQNFANGLINLHSPENIAACRCRKDLRCMLEMQLLTAWLCGKSMGVWSWWRCSRGLLVALDPAGRKFSPPIHMDSDRSHGWIFTKIGWSNWICWGTLNTYLKPFVLKMAGFSLLSARRKVAQNTHFTQLWGQSLFSWQKMWLPEGFRTHWGFRHKSLSLMWLSLISHDTKPLHLI